MSSPDASDTTMRTPPSVPAPDASPPSGADGAATPPVPSSIAESAKSIAAAASSSPSSSPSSSSSSSSSSSFWRWLTSRPSADAGASDVANPGVFDDLNQQAMPILHANAVEGLSFNFNTPLSEVFALGSSFEMGARDRPGTFAFNANYFTSNLALISRSTPGNGRIFARVLANHSPALSTKLNAEVGAEPDSSRLACDVDYRALRSSSQIKLASGRILAATHLHAVTKALSLGGEAMVQTRSGFTAFTLGGRYQVPGHSLCATFASYGPIVCSYVRQVSPKVSFAAELFVDMRSRESTVNAGYKFDLTNASITGRIDSSGKVTAVLEERINPAVALTLCGELDHAKDTQAFGIGVNIGGA